MAGKIYIGVAMVANKEVGGGDFFPRHVLEKAVADVQGVVASGKMIGTLNWGSIPTDEPEDISHVVTRIEMDGDDMIAEIEMLDTRAAKAFAKHTDIHIAEGSILPYPYITTSGDGSAGDDRVFTEYKISTVNAWAPNEYVFDRELAKEIGPPNDATQAA